MTAPCLVSTIDFSWSRKQGFNCLQISSGGSRYQSSLALTSSHAT